MIGISLMIVGIVTAVISGGLTGRMVARFGEKRTLYIGQFFAVGPPGTVIAGLAKTGAWLLASIPIISLWNISMRLPKAWMSASANKASCRALCKACAQSLSSSDRGCSSQFLGGLSMQKIRFTCPARLPARITAMLMATRVEQPEIDRRARPGSRCGPAGKHTLGSVSPLLLIRKKMFEYSVRESYLKSALSKAAI